MRPVLADVNMKSAITDGLRSRGLVIHRVQDIGSDRAEDRNLLDLATREGWVIVTYDMDFVVLASEALREGRAVAPVVHCKQHASIGPAIGLIESVARAESPPPITYVTR